MGTYNTLTNQPIDIHLDGDWYDNGWSISGGRATHISCNEGTIKNNTMPTKAGDVYKVRYVVSGYSSGSVMPIVGGTNGSAVSANGIYEEEITAADTSGLKFWSDGDLTIELIRVALGEVPAVTFSFDKNNLKWTSYWSYSPEMAARFLDGYFMWKDGLLWKANSNENRNNFFGQQYPSIVEFYVNINPNMMKTFYSIREVGTHAWEVSDVSIAPRAGKKTGQRSRIRKNRFRQLQGQWFADFLRNIDDPRFDDPNIALFKGAVLQGEVAKIRLEINESEEVRLVSVDVLGSQSEYSY